MITELTAEQTVQKWEISSVHELKGLDILRERKDG